MLDTERIGNVAGLLWNRLRQQNGKGCTISELKKTRGCTPDEVVAALGWLAREGKISVDQDGRRTVLTLVEHELCF